MEESLSFMEGELERLGSGVAPPCDARGAPSQSLS